MWKRLLVIGLLFFGGISMSNGAQNQTAIFAMGCFWCGAASFENHDTHKKFPGIFKVRSGYTGGELENPIYENHEGHKEGVQVTFDPKVIKYEALLDIFWHNVDPFDVRGQFCDQGFPYTSAIFYTTPEQQKLAMASKEAVEKKLGKSVLTEILPAKKFWDAEEYHQEYNIKNPIRYKYYRWNCGRDQRLKDVWGAWSYVHDGKK